MIGVRATLPLLLLPLLALACGAPAGRTRDFTFAAPTARVIPAAPWTPLELVCASETCGPGAVVRPWLDAQGAIRRYEIIESRRCGQLAELFFAPDGHRELMLPTPWATEVAVLTAGETTYCR